MNNPRFVWLSVWGLGFAVDVLNMWSDDLKSRRPECCGKIFLGPLLVTFSFPVGKWQSEVGHE